MTLARSFKSSMLCSPAPALAFVFGSSCIKSLHEEIRLFIKPRRRRRKKIASGN